MTFDRVHTDTSSSGQVYVPLRHQSVDPEEGPEQGYYSLAFLNSFSYLIFISFIIDFVSFSFCRKHMSI